MIVPRESGILATDDGQRIYWETHGNPVGKSAVVLHGGPGSGAGTGWTTYFDLERYNVLLFDQRGCGRSTPSAGDPQTDLRLNTTDHLIRDIEALRALCGAEEWLVLGGSWGTTLALAYAQAHPDRVSELVLFSVTTTTNDEVDWVTRQMGRVFPEQWERLMALVPAVRDAGDIPAAYAELLADPDVRIRGEAARRWCEWEDTHISLAPGHRPDPRYRDPEFRATFARLVTHYWSHAAWRADDELLAGVESLSNVPTVLVHGRYDISSPAAVPYRLHARWPGSELHLVDAGHGAGLGDPVTAAISRFAARKND